MVAVGEALSAKYEDELFARIQLAKLPDTDFETISEAANRFNMIVRQPGQHGEKLQAQLLISLMESRISEADATDMSRLGWLYMHNKHWAEEVAAKGLEKDENNDHCRRLLIRIRNNN